MLVWVLLCCYGVRACMVEGRQGSGINFMQKGRAKAILPIETHILVTELEGVSTLLHFI